MSVPSHRGRGDEWADPWMRSKSPSARKTGSGSRPSRRQSYSSGSSYSSSRLVGQPILARKCEVLLHTHTLLHINFLMRILICLNTLCLSSQHFFPPCQIFLSVPSHFYSLSVPCFQFAYVFDFPYFNVQIHSTSNYMKWVFHCMGIHIFTIMHYISEFRNCTISVILHKGGVQNQICCVHI